MLMCSGVSIGGRGSGGLGGLWPPTSIFKPSKVQQFQFQMSGIQLFIGVQKLYGPEISRLLQCMLQFLDNLLMFFLITKGK